MHSKDISMTLIEFQNLFPYGYDYHPELKSGDYIKFETQMTNAIILVKKVTKKKRWPAIDNEFITGWEKALVSNTFKVIDWYSDDSCRYIIMRHEQEDSISYRLSLQGFHNKDAFSIEGTYSQFGGHRLREYDLKVRLLRNHHTLPIDIQAESDKEAYDMLYPDHPLSHCRRLGNAIAISLACMPAKKISRN